MTQKQKLNIIFCPNCHGDGFIDNKKCPQCRGLGMVMPFYGFYLYWGKKFDRLNILLDKAAKTVDRLINLLLIIIGIFGIFALFFIAYQNNFELFFTYEYWISATWEKLLFWFTVLTDLYLYYRLMKEKSLEKNVFPKVFGQQPQMPPQLDWQFILSESKRKFIDISNAYEEQALKVLEQAWFLARQFNHAEAERAHIFAIIPQFEQGALIWGRLGVDIKKFQEKVGKVLNWKIEGKSQKTLLATEVYKILFYAYLDSYNKRKRKVQLLEIVLGLINLDIFDKQEITPDYVEQVLIDLDLDYQKIENVVEWIRIQRSLRENLQRFQARARYRSKSGLDRAMTAAATPFLDQFSTDLTLAAKKGQLFPCIGREKEFEQMFRIIEASREGILLIGNQGVGRTSIVYGLAQKMVEETVPEAIKDKRLVLISTAKLLSGATTATAQERLMTMAAEISRSRNIVVVFEDLHNLFSLGSDQEQGLDLSEVLAELLSKGLFYVIATTTNKNYRQTIEGSSLDEYFRTINVEEMLINDAIQVLEAKSGPIEYKNKVYFSYDAIEKAAQLSSRYLHEKYLPEKALEIMEEVAVKVRNQKGEKAVIAGEDVANIISAKTGVKATKVTEKESEKLLNLETEIHQRVIGQDEAVKMVAASLRRARAELRDVKRPIANLLFLGPTGVGKTELAKTVAEVYFGNEKNMLRFDMSEFQDQASLSRLIGTVSRGGILTEAVRQKPFSLLLFDEVEKANKDILNLFLQVMDDARLTDGMGRTIDFTNIIIIMTSNAGAQVIQDEIRQGTTIDDIKEILINEELKKHFRPEFINRFDGVIVFKPLTMTEVIQIARLLANKVIARLADKNIDLKITDEAIAELAELGYDPKFGARPLRRIIQEKVDDTLADHLLAGKIKKRDQVILLPGGQLEIKKAEEL